MCVLLTGVPLATSDMPRYIVGAQCWGGTVQDVEPPLQEASNTQMGLRSLGEQQHGHTHHKITYE